MPGRIKQQTRLDEVAAKKAAEKAAKPPKVKAPPKAKAPKKLKAIADVAQPTELTLVPTLPTEDTDREMLEQVSALFPVSHYVASYCVAFCWAFPQCAVLQTLPVLEYVVVGSGIRRCCGLVVPVEIDVCLQCG